MLQVSISTNRFFQPASDKRVFFSLWVTNEFFSACEWQTSFFQPVSDKRVFFSLWLTNEFFSACEWQTSFFSLWLTNEFFSACEWQTSFFQPVSDKRVFFSLWVTNEFFSACDWQTQRSRRGSCAALLCNGANAAASNVALAGHGPFRSYLRRPPRCFLSNVASREARLFGSRETGHVRCNRYWWRTEEGGCDGARRRVACCDSQQTVPVQRLAITNKMTCATEESGGVPFAITVQSSLVRAEITAPIKYSKLAHSSLVRRGDYLHRGWGI